ncbi:MAG: 3-isopropylmalate dehydrogenase, partial [Elusimicrobia bacterium]|nr:3-isopropylmalate dehydrogenase [Elusimicrobiota bacterium]
MKKKIGVLEGDYIGPEITGEALKALDAIGEKFNHTFERVKLYASGEAYDKFGEILPKETLEKGAECDALLKGPFGGPPEEINHPKWSQVEKEAILPLRKHYNLYANLRETKVYESLLDISPLKPERIKGTNILIVRELISGIYFGEKKSGTIDGERFASDTEKYTESEIRRIAIKAFELAMTRRRKLTLVAKSNILFSSQLWREVVAEVQPNYPDVDFDYMHVDNASMQLI